MKLNHIINVFISKLYFFWGIKYFIRDLIKVEKKNNLKKLSTINQYLTRSNKKIINFRESAFGFAICQLDYLFKYIKFNKLDKSNFIFISNKIKNKYLKFIIEDKLNIKIKEREKIYSLLISTFPKKKYFGNNFVICPADCGNYDYKTDLKINFTQKEKEYGDNLLRKIGINNDTKFVIFSYKSSTYYSKYLNNLTEPNSHSISQSYRMSDYKRLLKTLNYLETMGLKSLNINYLDKDEEKYFKDFPKLQSIENIDDRNFLEFYVNYKCEFGITGNSGDQFLSKLFEKKNLLHNGIIPHSLSHGIFLPKKFKDKNSGKMLSLKEVLSRRILYHEKSDISKLISLPPTYFRDTQHFLNKNLVIIENTEDEILEATKEMCELNKYNFLKLSSKDHNKQESLKEIYTNSFYETTDVLKKKKIGSYISPSFLKKNKYFA